MATTKIWCVAITNEGDPHNPILDFVEALTQQEAKDISLYSNKLTEEDIDGSTELDVLVVEVNPNEIIK